MKSKTRYFLNLSADITDGAEPFPNDYCPGITEIDGRTWANYERTYKTKRAALRAFDRLPEYAFSVTAFTPDGIRFIRERGTVLF